MKKIFTLIAILFCLSPAGYAQYYYLPYLNAGQNPGGLNVDNEYPAGGGLPAGWTTIQANSSTPVWSPVQTVPFTFSFNGSVVTNYKVSNTGVLTFDTGTSLSAPSSSN